MLDPKVFEACFKAWISTLTADIVNDIIAIDGKTSRGSSNKSDDVPALHFVSAWAAKSRLMLGQVKTEDKSNEITAIPKLLDMIDIAESVVTIDAIGCQKKATMF